LDKSDSVISMSIMRHFEAEADERVAYLKQAAAQRRALADEDADADIDVGADDEAVIEDAALSVERYAEMGAAEEFILTITEKGFGKRSSSFDFRISGRGGKGIKATDQSKRDEIGRLVAALPIDDADQIMLVSNSGQLIRVPVNNIRFASRASKGVTVFKTAKDENVVSVERVSEPEDDEDGEDVESNVSPNENDTGSENSEGDAES